MPAPDIKDVRPATDAAVDGPKPPLDKIEYAKFANELALLVDGQQRQPPLSGEPEGSTVHQADVSAKGSREPGE